MEDFKTRKKRVVNDGKGIKLGDRVSGKVGDTASGTSASVASQPASREERRRIMRSLLADTKKPEYSQQQAAAEKRRKFDKALFDLNRASNRKALREGKETDFETSREILRNYQPSKEGQRKGAMKQRARKWTAMKSKRKED